MIYACAVISILFIADFAGLLWQASLAIHAGFVICGVVLLWGERRNLLSGRSFQLEPRSLAVAATIIFLFAQVVFLTAPAQFHSWDEFSHWGTVIRAISAADTFHLNPNPLYFQDYPPGLALFAYHVLELVGFTEGHVYFSYVLLMGCLSASLLHMAAGVSFARFVFSVLVLWLCVQFIAEGWISVLIDHVLALFFMGCVSFYLLLRERGGPLFVLPICIFAFALTKQAASSLALLATGIVLVDLVISRSVQERERATFWLRSAALAACLIGANWLASHSWSAYVDAAGLQRGWGSYSPVGLLGKFMGCCTTPRELNVAHAFFGRYFGSDLPVAVGTVGSPAYLAWLSVSEGPWSLIRVQKMLGSTFAQMAYLWLAGLVVARFAARRLDRFRTIAFSFLMAAGAGGYALSLLLAYLYSFSEYEALNLASFNRFFTVYLIAWLSSALAYYAMTIPDPENQRLRNLTYVGFGIGLLVLAGVQVRSAKIIVSPGVYQEYATNQKVAAREIVQSLVRPMLPGIPPTAKVYILWPDNTGYEFWLTKYEMLPRQTNLVCFAITSRPQPNFVQECAVSEEEFRRQLSQYDVVIVGQKLHRLREEYPGLFAALSTDKETGLFKIEKTPVPRLSPLLP